MKELQEIFGVFFAISWGGVVAAEAKFKPFGWLGCCWVDFKRTVFSILILNLVPAIYFAGVIYFLAPIHLSQIWDFSDLLKIVAVILMAFWGMIGIYRFWFFGASYWRDHLYSPQELTEYCDDLKGLKRELALGNFLSASCYLTFSILLIVVVRF